MLETGGTMKKVLITGGATGIGSACARLFAEKGYDVFITCHESEPDLDCVTPITCDLRKEEDIKANFKNGILTVEFPKEPEKKVEEKKYIPIGE